MSTVAEYVKDCRDVLIGALPVNFPIKWPAKPFTAPVSKSTPWARFSLEHTVGGQASLGPRNGRLWRAEGLISIDLMGQPNGGVDDPYTLAESVLQAYTNRTPRGVVFYRARIGFEGTGTGDDTGWFVVSVFAEFMYQKAR